MAAFNTPATLSILRGYVRNLILERSGDVGLVTDAELNDLINIAARTIWVRIANKYPDVFAQRSTASTTVASGALIPFSSIVTGGANAGNLYRILNAYVGPVAAAESAMEMIHELDKIKGRHVYEQPGTTGLLAPPALPFRFYVEGHNVGFSPRTSGSFDVRFQFTQQPQDMTLDADVCWGGYLPTFHDYVAMLAGQLAISKDANLQTPMDQVLGVVDSILREQFGPPYNPYSTEPKEPRP